MTRRLLALLAVLPVLAACGGGSSPSSSGFPTIQAAKTYSLVRFSPAGRIAPGVPTRISFQIRQPNGKPLTSFKTGSGPHTGVHLILVRRDLSTIIHTHPPIGADGRIGTSVTFTEPGPYKVVVDAYPNTNGPQRNFQLFTTLTVTGKYAPRTLPPFQATDVVDGYRITLHGNPTLRAIEPGFLHATVTAPDGTPATFTPWFGALAHAIFFRAGSLDYFHTHVCAPGASGCTSVLGQTKVTGSSSTPGKLSIGVLVPVAGTWRLFLQCLVQGHVLTAPFTLTVKS